MKELRRRGYSVVQCNYRNALGEIDIIARDRRTIVFIEVKTRRSRRFGDAKYAVTTAKQRKLSMVALAYLKEEGLLNRRARFDVMTIRLENRTPTVELVKNAFTLAYG